MESELKKLLYHGYGLSVIVKCYLKCLLSITMKNNIYDLTNLARNKILIWKRTLRIKYKRSLERRDGRWILNPLEQVGKNECCS